MEKIREEMESSDVPMTLIALTRSFGESSAILAGVKHVRNDSDFVMTVTPDVCLTDELVRRMIGLLEQGNNAVQIVRSAEKEWDEKFLDMMVEKPFLPEYSNVFMFDRTILEAILSEKYSPDNFQNLIHSAGFKLIILRESLSPRLIPQPPETLISIVERLAHHTIATSRKPLTIISIVGACLFGLGIVVSIFSLFGSLGAMLMFLTGLELLAISLVANVVSRLTTESFNRPNYIIAERVNFED
jgi:hypothetical protein